MSAFPQIGRPLCEPPENTYADDVAEWVLNELPVEQLWSHMDDFLDKNPAIRDAFHDFMAPRFDVHVRQVGEL